MKPSAVTGTHKKRFGTSKADRKKRFSEVLALLESYYPEAECALHHKNAFELLIATILSAQCTDERVNLVTPALFKRYPTVQAMARAELSDLEQEIRSINFYKNKARSLRACCEKLLADYKGQVPQVMEELIQLPGVGRKTANVILGVAFGVGTGIVVDTHVARLSYRLGFTREVEPKHIEQDLMKLAPPSHWIELPHLLITHGRRICKARRPQCEVCFLEALCPQRI